MPEMQQESISPRKTARLAGLLWLLTGLTGAFSIAYVRPRIVAFKDVDATANNIITSESLFRAGIGSYIISQIVFLLLGLTLYRLLKDVNRAQARIMLGFIAMSGTIAIANSVNNVAALMLAGNVDFLNAFQRVERNALMMMFLKLFNQGLGITEMLMGLSFFFLGLLIVRSGFIPKILGVMLMASCFGFLINSFTALAFPQYHSAILTMIAMALSGLSVLPTTLWLLVKGVKSQPL